MAELKVSGAEMAIIEEMEESYVLNTAMQQWLGGLHPEWRLYRVDLDTYPSRAYPKEWRKARWWCYFRNIEDTSRLMQLVISTTPPHDPKGEEFNPYAAKAGLVSVYGHVNASDKDCFSVDNWLHQEGNFLAGTINPDSEEMRELAAEIRSYIDSEGEVDEEDPEDEDEEDPAPKAKPVQPKTRR